MILGDNDSKLHSVGLVKLFESHGIEVYNGAERLWEIMSMVTHLVLTTACRQRLILPTFFIKLSSMSKIKKGSTVDQGPWLCGKIPWLRLGKIALLRKSKSSSIDSQKSCKRSSKLKAEGLLFSLGWFRGVLIHLSAVYFSFLMHFASSEVNMFFKNFLFLIQKSTGKKSEISALFETQK